MIDKKVTKYNIGRKELIIFFLFAVYMLACVAGIILSYRTGLIDMAKITCRENKESYIEGSFDFETYKYNCTEDNIYEKVRIK